MGGVEEVLQLVGLTDVAKRRVKGYSLGMRQRLGLAGVMLGDPHTVILDEPANGLDPEGIRWIRDILVHLAQQGRTVLVSSHLLSEMALMAQDLVVIGRGRLIEQCSVERLHRSPLDEVGARAEPADRPARRGHRFRRRQGATARPRPVRPPNAAQVYEMPVEAVGELAASHQFVLHELTVRTESLEDAFLAATAAEQEYRTQAVQP